MELTPHDIRDRSFSTSLRGLNAEEVSSFLEKVADHLEEVTSRRQELEERVDSLESKLNKIRDTVEKAQTAKERARAARRDAEAKQQRLEAKERKLEEERQQIRTTHRKLEATARRLQETIQEEKQTLSRIASQEEALPSDNEQGEQEKTTEEWVDSLFPNRLGSGSTQDSSSEEPPSEPSQSASKSQFEAIKEDVQGMESKGSTSPTPPDREEDASTDEVQRIWDVFEQSEDEQSGGT